MKAISRAVKISLASAGILLSFNTLPAGSAPQADASQAACTYDSGWVPFPPDQPHEVYLDHNLGGDPGSYWVDLKFRAGGVQSDTGIHNNGIGGLYDHTSGATQGGYYSELTADNVKLTRYEDDLPVSDSPHAEFRVLIFRPPSTATSADFAISERGLKPGQSFPNPFKSQTIIRLETPHAGPATLRILDVAGRLVASRFKGELGSGNHMFDWDGTCDDGSQATSGIYFYEFEFDGAKVAKKMVKLD